MAYSLADAYAEEYEANYDESDYYSYAAPRKKKSLSVSMFHSTRSTLHFSLIQQKIDRLVQRFPTLGVFYKQPPSSFDKTNPKQHSSSSREKMPKNYVEPPQFPRELTADELAMSGRYSNTLNVRFIDLEAKDQTQPVDVRIQQDTNRVYLCDVGRGVVEIFDLHGVRQHVIDDPIMSKFQPTALVMAFDGTIIVASHFNHCLHMYTPMLDEQKGDADHPLNSFKYQQYKLGTSGNQLHQFFHPAGISIDHRDGYLYVCDRGNYRIKVLTPQGICERVIELVINGKKKQILDPSRIACQTLHDQLVCIFGTGDAICFLSRHANG